MCADKGVTGVGFGDAKLAENIISDEFLRKDNIGLPQKSELEVLRHYKELSDKNFCVETGMYPLGSCTMKYNPKVNELMASLEGFANLHPLQSDEDSQGALELMYNLQEALKVLTGMDAVSLQPAAGAHGEFSGMLVIKKYFEVRGESRKKVIVPDSAHGTNPASASMAGFEIVQVKSNERGQVDVSDLKTILDEQGSDIAAIMMTNPNTVGIFEEQVLEISKLMHENGSLLYYDGANLNAVMGYSNPAIMGFDVCHINLHKTFSTPHGGGGPGAGPIGVVEKLKDYLPTPVVEFDGNKYLRNYNLPNSIGKVRSFYGNFGVFVRAYTYILMMGKDLKHATEDAVLNANYLREKLKDVYDIAYDERCMHEFVICGEKQKEQGSSTLHIAKRLMDYKIHPPTVYFPLIVHEAIMVEPTESESKERLDNFVAVMRKIAEEIKENPEMVNSAPHNAPIKKVDETLAARKPDLNYAKVQ